MIHKIKTLILSASLLLAFAAPVALPTPVSAVEIQKNVCGGANTLQLGTNADGSSTSANCTDTNATTKVNDIITLLLNIFSVVVGIIAVVMIIVAGFRYITSGGKDDAVKGAKNTILYAIIGLVVVALAQIIVKFVLNQATKS